MRRSDDDLFERFGDVTQPGRRELMMNVPHLDPAPWRSRKTTSQLIDEALELVEACDNDTQAYRERIADLEAQGAMDHEVTIGRHRNPWQRRLDADLGLELSGHLESVRAGEAARKLLIARQAAWNEGTQTLSGLGRRNFVTEFGETVGLSRTDREGRY